MSRPKNPRTNSRTSPKKRAATPAASTETAAPAFTHAAVANQYARDVVAGRVSACKWVKLACQRHLNDLAREKAGWIYIFDEAKANHVCRFIEKLPHTKGSWASRRENIKLQPWQCFILCCIFGWLKRESRTRRFSLAYVAVSRKNGKSILAGGIGNYMLAADGEFGSEVYSGATSEKQAWEVFRPALDMVKRTPALQEAFGITAGAQRMFIEADGSRFEPVIGKPGDGASPHCGIVDEYHEHDTDTLFDTFRTGMGARLQPLLLVITTAGDNLAGPCKALQEDLEKVLEGSIEREEFFGLAYTIDASDDWASEEALRKANPNYGVSVFEDFLKVEQRNALNNARKQGVFKTKHLNVWVGATSAFFNVQKWNELADPSLKASEFRGLPCVGGSDLSSKKDFTACVLVFKKLDDKGKEHYYVFPRFYLPENEAMLPDKQHYQKWVKDGYVKTTPGGRIDIETITNDTIADVQTYKVREICYDDWHAESYAQAVEKRTRALAVQVPQNAKCLTGPMKQVEALIADGCIHHDGNPVMAWMMGNVVAKEDAKGELLPRKERQQNNIDGPAAMLTAMFRGLLMPTQVVQSVYATRGIRSL